MAGSFSIQNAPDLGNLNDFRSLVGSNGDLAKAARFAVVIDGVLANGGRELQYLCESAELPGRGLQTDEARTYGPNFRTPYQSAYTDVSLTFLCRAEMAEKDFFDLWIDQINPKSNYDFAYRDDYATTVSVYQFSELGYATYKATLRSAYPINVSPLPLNWAEDNFHRLQVTFAYTDWVTPPNSVSNVMKGTL